MQRPPRPAAAPSASPSTRRPERRDSSARASPGRDGDRRFGVPDGDLEREPADAQPGLALRHQGRAGGGWPARWRSDWPPGLGPPGQRSGVRARTRASRAAPAGAEPLAKRGHRVSLTTQTRDAPMAKTQLPVRQRRPRRRRRREGPAQGGMPSPLRALRTEGPRRVSGWPDGRIHLAGSRRRILRPLRPEGHGGGRPAACRQRASAFACCATTSTVPV